MGYGLEYGEEWHGMVRSVETTDTFEKLREVEGDFKEINYLSYDCFILRDMKKLNFRGYIIIPELHPSVKEGKIDKKGIIDKTKCAGLRGRRNTKKKRIKESSKLLNEVNSLKVGDHVIEIRFDEAFNDVSPYIYYEYNNEGYHSIFDEAVYKEMHACEKTIKLACKYLSKKYPTFSTLLQRDQELEKLDI